MSYLTLSEAATRCPRRVHMSTMWRWARRGVRARNGQRVHLEHVRIGGRVMVEETALGEFFRALAQADIAGFDAESDAPTPKLPKSPESPDRAAAIEHAKRTCFG